MKDLDSLVMLETGSAKPGSERGGATGVHERD